MRLSDPTALPIATRPRRKQTINILKNSCQGFFNTTVLSDFGLKDVAFMLVFIRRTGSLKNTRYAAHLPPHDAVARELWDERFCSSPRCPIGRVTDSS